MGKNFKEWTDKEKNEMVKLHNDGFLNRELAQKFQTSTTMISRLLRSMDVESRHPMLSEERKIAIRDCYIEHKNLQIVKKIMKCSTDTVVEILKEYDVKQLSISEMHRKYKIDENYFSVIDTQNKAYSLGMIFSDGTVSKNGNHIAIALQEGDKPLLDRLNHEFGGDRYISFLDYKSKNPNYQNQYCLTVTNKKMHDDLIMQGAVPNKSLILRFPQNVPKDLIRHFVRGYFDGDGTVRKNECRCSLLSTEDFCKTLAQIIKEELGVHCSIMLTHGNAEKSTRVLSIAGRKQVKKFLDWIYKDAGIYLERKYNIYLSKYYPDINNSLLA